MKATWIHGQTGKPVSEVEIDLSGDVRLEGLGLRVGNVRHGYLTQDGYRYELSEQDYLEAERLLGGRSSPQVGGAGNKKRRRLK